MAQVTLKDALTYSHKNRTFVKGQALTITNPEEVAYFKANAHFDVQEDPKPVAPRRAVAKPLPAPEEETEEVQEEEVAQEEEAPSGDVTEEELAVAEEEEQPPAPVAKKPAARKGQFQKGGTRK